MRRSGGIAVATALVTLLAACGSNPRPTGSSSAPTSPTSSSTVVTGPPSSEPASPTSAPPPSEEPTATTAPAGDACPSSGLTVSALPGSGSSGTQYEILQFTNSGTSTCSLDGFPTVSLRLDGAALGDPASASSVAAQSVSLAPGAVATAVLSGPSTCDAPLSDTVRVSAPGATDFVDVPAVVRGCTLTVDPVAPA